MQNFIFIEKSTEITLNLCLILTQEKIYKFKISETQHNGRRVKKIDYAIGKTNARETIQNYLQTNPQITLSELEKWINQIQEQSPNAIEIVKIHELEKFRAKKGWFFNNIVYKYPKSLPVVLTIPKKKAEEVVNFYQSQINW